MEFLAGLLMAPYFWLAISFAAFVLIAALTEDDGPGKATLVLAVLAVVLEVFSPFKPLSLAISSPVLAAVYVGAYLAVGAFYGILKWWRYVVVAREVFDADIADSLKRRGAATLAELASNIRESVIERATNKAVGYGNSIPPQIAEHKAKFMGWAAYWPLSGAWTLLNDPVRRVFNAIYNGLASTLQDISNRSFGDVPSKKG